MIYHSGVIPGQSACSPGSAFHHLFRAVCSAFTVAVAIVFWTQPPGRLWVWLRKLADAEGGRGEQTRPREEGEEIGEGL